MSDKCNCEKQIVWFFDRPTVIVCYLCQVTLWHGAIKCPYCDGPLTYFKADFVETEEEEEVE